MDSIKKYIIENLEKGFSKDQILNSLIKSNYSEELIKMKFKEIEKEKQSIFLKINKLLIFILIFLFLNFTFHTKIFIYLFQFIYGIIFIAYTNLIIIIFSLFISPFLYFLLILILKRTNLNSKKIFIILLVLTLILSSFFIFNLYKVKSDIKPLIDESKFIYNNSNLNQINNSRYYLNSKDNNIYFRNYGFNNILDKMILVNNSNFKTFKLIEPYQDYWSLAYDSNNLYERGSILLSLKNNSEIKVLTNSDKFFYLVGNKFVYCFGKPPIRNEYLLKNVNANKFNINSIDFNGNKIEKSPFSLDGKNNFFLCQNLNNLIFEKFKKNITGIFSIKKVIKNSNYNFRDFIFSIKNENKTYFFKIRNSYGWKRDFLELKNISLNGFK